ncbi:MAG: carboxylating nicotinate-nucleotide diphosphorylase [Mariprofundales bacterium]
MNLQSLIDASLEEDAANHDITVRATIEASMVATAQIVAKADGVLSGVTVAQQVFATVDGALQQQWHKECGARVVAGEQLARISGLVGSILSAERVALNFLQHLSGIATATSVMVQAVAGTGCAIADTRKTTPGLRAVEKQAVVDGGGINHRADLAGGFLIKENHIAAVGSIAQAVACCRASEDAGWIEVECESLEQVRQAVLCAPDMILLDNMRPEVIAEARVLVPDSITLEASGGITLANVRQYAEQGVDRIAIGAITHSTSALDLSLLLQ